jgi:cation diffusion facilitator family transporter
MSGTHTHESSPANYLWLSIGAAVATIALKLTAWQLTGSVGLMSDALESFVNLAGAGFALWMVVVSRRPADPEHPFGHGKAEYFSSGFEGILILGAAVAIAWSAVLRFVHPTPLESLDWGLALASFASVINFAVARSLFAAAKRHRSMALDGDARHLMTDVWTSAGVLVGLAIAGFTDVLWLDPLVAILVALNIAREAIRLIRASGHGLLDQSLPAEEIAEVERVVREFTSASVRLDNIRTRRSGYQSFMNATLVVPGDWSVAKAHVLADELESALSSALPHLRCVLHIEPGSRIEAPAP